MKIDKLPRKKKKQHKKLMLWFETKAKELGYITKYGVSLAMVVAVTANEMVKKNTEKVKKYNEMVKKNA